MKFARSWEIWVVGVLLFLSGLAGSATGANLLDRVKDQELTQTLSLRIGHSKVLRAPYSIKRISVANPKIADIVLISEKEIYVNGLASGVTNLNLWGRSRFTSVTVMVEADLALLKEMLHRVLPKEKIAVKAAGDSIVLSGEVSSPAAQHTALAVASAFVGGQKSVLPGGDSGNVGGEASQNVSTSIGTSRDVVKPGEITGEEAHRKENIINLLHIGGVQQVMVAVRVAEINRNVGRRIGINLSGISGRGNFGTSMLDGLATFGLTTLVSNKILSEVKSGWRTHDFTALDGSGISSAVNAMGGFKGGGVLWTLFFAVLKEKGLGRILAEPNLVTTSGQKASFLAGGEFPVPKPGVLGTVGIDYKKYGVQLEFTPTVLDAGKIAMRVRPEVSEIDETLSPLIIQGLLIPGLRTRSTDTHVEVRNGQTFAIAGLLSDTSRTVHNKFPILGDIPILGTLFRSSNYQKNETELVILVTPSLVKPMTSQKVRLPTDAYVEPNDLEFYLLGDMEGKKGKPKPAPSTSPALPLGFGHQPVK